MVVTAGQCGSLLLPENYCLRDDDIQTNAAQYLGSQENKQKYTATTGAEY